MKDINAYVLSSAAMCWGMANTKFMLENGPKTKERFAEIIGSMVEHHLKLHNEHPDDGHKLIAETLSKTMIDLGNF